MTVNPFEINPSPVIGMGLLAATPLTGVALVNGTQTFLTWTAPSDGQLHRVIVASVIHVTSAETGGQIQQIYTPFPGGAPHNGVLFNAGLGSDTAGQVAAAIFSPVAPGSTVTVSQTSALTAGAATLWAEIWGS